MSGRPGAGSAAGLVAPSPRFIAPSPTMEWGLLPNGLLPNGLSTWLSSGFGFAFGFGFGLGFGFGFT